MVSMIFLLTAVRSLVPSSKVGMMRVGNRVFSRFNTMNYLHYELQTFEENTDDIKLL